VREAALLGGFDVRFSENLERDLPDAAVMVYITHAEGLGSAALMAMAYGVPVAASAVGGLREVVDDGVTGYLTENDAASIAAAVERALRGRARLGAAARARVRERFTTSRMVEETRRVYGLLE
jgi:glycosyltransferase involved in cell wall biosynthesis